MNWSVRVLSLMLLVCCTWALSVPVAMADQPVEPSSHLIGIDTHSIDTHLGPTSLSDITASTPLESVDTTPEVEPANKIAEPGSIGLVALMALMGGGAMMMRRRLG